MKKVLITGGCGYIGARLGKYLGGKGYGVTIFDAFDPAKYHEWTSTIDRVIVGDIRDDAILSELGDMEFDTIIHLISLDHHKSESEPNVVCSLNVMPTWNLLDRFTQKGLKTFINFSTVHVYGKIPNRLITEKEIPDPKNAYALTHLLSENIVNYYHGKTRTNCLNVRLSNSYGSPVFNENNCWWLVLNDFCKTAFAQNKIKLSSDGSPLRDFIHGSDICKAVEILIRTENHAQFSENTYHIASGNTYMILELAHLVKRVHEKRYQREIPIYLGDNSISDSLAGDMNAKRFSFDTSRIRNLGFESRIDPEIGINELFDYLENV